ncbi:MAG: hypothetical protein GXO77_14640 [Calditrichaeota bacterium]|nr:hypothetical protein [Calditrichota bacterium]
MSCGNSRGRFGQGPRANKDSGCCSDEENPGYERDSGIRRGFGRGFGRGFWRLNLPWSQQPAPEKTASLTSGNELSDTQNELNGLRSAVEGLLKRINELTAKSEGSSSDNK